MYMQLFPRRCQVLELIVWFNFVRGKVFKCCPGCGRMVCPFFPESRWLPIHYDRVCACMCHIPLFANPWTAACPAPLFMEFSSQAYWSGLPFPTPGDLFDPGIEPTSLSSPALAGRFFTNWTGFWPSNQQTILLDILLYFFVSKLYLWVLFKCSCCFFTFIALSISVYWIHKIYLAILAFFFFFGWIFQRSCLDLELSLRERKFHLWFNFLNDYRLSML